MMGPGLFSNIGKRAKNLLTKGCTRDQKLTISTVTASVLVLTSASVKKKELYTHDISSVYKHKNTVINVIMGAESNISTTLTVLEALPSTNLLICVELPDNKGGKLELHYCHFHKNASFATKIGMKPYPVLKISGTVGAPGVALGAEVQYDTAKGEFTKYNAAIGLTKVIGSKCPVCTTLMRSIGPELQLNSPRSCHATKILLLLVACTGLIVGQRLKLGSPAVEGFLLFLSIRLSQSHF